MINVRMFSSKLYISVWTNFLYSTLKGYSIGLKWVMSQAIYVTPVFTFTDFPHHYGSSSHFFPQILIITDSSFVLLASCCFSLSKLSVIKFLHRSSTISPRPTPSHQSIQHSLHLEDAANLFQPQSTCPFSLRRFRTGSSNTHLWPHTTK